MNMDFWYNTFIPYASLANSKNVNKKKLNAFKNSAERRNAFMNLYNLALDTFEWEGLPETCDARFLEMQLLVMGYAGIYNNPDAGLQTLGFLPLRFNTYGQPVEGNAFGYFGQVDKVNCFVKGSINDNANAVMLRDNLSAYPMINYITMYAERLANTMNAIDSTSFNLQIPYLITCEQSQVNSFKELFNKVDMHEPVIPVSDALNPDNIQPMILNPNPEILRAQWDHYRNLDNEIRTFLGIQNQCNNDKKERLLVDEVNSNNAVTDDHIAMRLRQREEFCENINSFFGLNVSVKINESRSMDMQQYANKDNQEVEEDENI